MMVNQVVSSLQNDHQQQIAAAVEKARSEEKVNIVCILDRLFVPLYLQEEAERMLEEVRKESEKNKAVALEGVKELLSTAQQEIDNLKAVSLDCIVLEQA